MFNDAGFEGVGKMWKLTVRQRCVWNTSLEKGASWEEMLMLAEFCEVKIPLEVKREFYDFMLVNKFIEVRQSGMVIA